MRVLYIHDGDEGNGGGQVQMLRLQAELRRREIDARICCPSPGREDSIALPHPGLVDAMLRPVCRLAGINDIHAVRSFRITSIPEFRDADVIDIQGIHGNFFSYLALPKLSRDKPVVFTLHDMWAITGHCHNSLDCERWRSGCGRCPYPDTAPAISRDSSGLEWKLKDRSYGRSNLCIVAPSAWLADRAREGMLGRFEVHQIPHGVGTDTLRPLDPDECRKRLGIPAGKRVLLTATNDLNRELKGGDLLCEALAGLPATMARETVLLLLGHNGERLAGKLPVESIPLGFVGSDRAKAAVFSAADLFVHPSRAENFPLVLIESLACGTPVAAFGVGGVPEIVRPGLTGRVARPEDAADLARVVEALLDDAGARSEMSRHCRRIAVEEYSLREQANRYLDLYRTLIDTRSTAGRGRDAG